MPEHIYQKKYNKKDGSIVVYSYSKNTSIYSKNYYNKQINQPKISCEHCDQLVYPHYLAKHQATKKCRKLQTLSEASDENLTLEEIKEIWDPPGE